MRDLDTFQAPKLLLRIFKWFCRPAYHMDIEGDLLEIFQNRAEKKNLRYAKWMLAFDILLLFRPSIIRSFSLINLINHLTMYRHHFLISWRHLGKNKAYALLNIGGLALGMSVFILIGLWLKDEISFNKNHEHYHEIAAVYQNQNFSGQIKTWITQPKQMAPLLRETYGSNFDYVVRSSFNFGHTLTYQDRIIDRNGSYMEPDAPDLLSLEMLQGTKGGLADLNSILLSASTAKALFGEEDPLNQAIRFDNKHDLKVAGVYKDLPDNSSFANLTFITTWALYETSLPDWLGWGNSWFRLFVKIAPNVDMQQASENIRNSKSLAIDDPDLKDYKPVIFLHPMSDWHLRGEFENGVNIGGRIKFVWLYGIIGLFVLLLACINFMNLSTARSEKRAREVGVRKALGSHRGALMGQFYSESLLTSAFAIILSLLIAQLFLPTFNLVADKSIAIPWLNPVFILGLFLLIFVTAFLSGSYPAVYLSSFVPSKVLKGSGSAGPKAVLPRRVLVILQFTVSVSLITGTIIVFQQIQHAKDRPLGYDTDNLINVFLKNDQLTNHFDAFKRDLEQTGLIASISRSETSITNSPVTNSGFEWQGKDPNLMEEFYTVRINHEFGETLGWEITEGRDFSRDFSTDTTGFIINETAARYMGLENPVGTRVEWGENETYTIIGVVKDLLMRSPYSPVEPVIFFIEEDLADIANIRLKEEVAVDQALASIENIYQKYDGQTTFEYRFIDEAFAKKFENEERVARLASFFAVLAILISCLGLLGMASFVTEKRKKELSIRKVLGANTFNLWQLVSKEFILLVAIASIISIPISYGFLNNWLQEFVYHIHISPWIFIIVFLGAILLTLATVSIHAIKAAIRSPIQSLRSE